MRDDIGVPYISNTWKGKTMLATRPDTDTIAITRTFDGIEEAAHCVISQIGGMASVIEGAKYEACSENVVSLKGYSGARRLS